MKAVLTFVAVIFFSTAIFANSTSKEIKVAAKTVSVELNVTLNQTTILKSETKVARLYKFKNSRIKKALAFKTKRNKAKMA
ncbi:hypothetical protein MTsPCn5_38950 [Croceitalea sp. MTPC5]|uniref:hypothetical protein n=1 Tax=Croceitalea sp. MTPC5 TaxID=3056565 RepID=UPI002B3FAE02|nr:hypothetical protein MTsPCn5_38950 [Croceitalea sp. MTPC5]